MLETRFNTLDSKYSEITPEILKLSELCFENSSINPEMYTKYQVNRGLRDVNGNGVLTGLTEISEIKSFDIIDGVKTPCEGKLYYRGFDAFL
jgi:citrate synthase